MSNVEKVPHLPSTTALPSSSDRQEFREESRKIREGYRFESNRSISYLLIPDLYIYALDSFLDL